MEDFRGKEFLRFNHLARNVFSWGEIIDPPFLTGSFRFD
jgi:hypothetical protein